MCGFFIDRIVYRVAERTMWLAGDMVRDDWDNLFLDCNALCSVRMAVFDFACDFDVTFRNASLSEK